MTTKNIFDNNSKGLYMTIKEVEELENKAGFIDLKILGLALHITPIGISNLFEIDVRDKEGYAVAGYKQKHAYGLFELTDGVELSYEVKLEFNRLNDRGYLKAT